jgi:hypothetical protein
MSRLYAAIAGVCLLAGCDARPPMTEGHVKRKRVDESGQHWLLLSDLYGRHEWVRCLPAEYEHAKLIGDYHKPFPVATPQPEAGR